MAAKDAALARIHAGTDYAALEGADLLIEVATENPQIKFKILQQLEGLAAEDATIATNTSSISITQLVAVLKRPERFVGVHFFTRCR